MTPPAQGRKLWGRGPSDVLLFVVTAVELALLIYLSSGFGVTDWIYVCSNLLVLAIALTRRPANSSDRGSAIGRAGRCRPADRP